MPWLGLGTHDEHAGVLCQSTVIGLTLVKELQRRAQRIRAMEAALGSNSTEIVPVSDGPHTHFWSDPIGSFSNVDAEVAVTVVAARAA
jgi:hypothetical protein